MEELVPQALEKAKSVELCDMGTLLLLLRAMQPTCLQGACRMNLGQGFPERRRQLPPSRGRVEA